MESELAGLGFRFAAVPLKITAGSSSPRAAGARGSSRGSTDSGGGGAVDRPRAARTDSSVARSKSVGFNLKERRPGTSYSSPEPAAAAVPEQVRSSSAERALAASGSPRQPATAPTSASSSLAHLKLASLRRRAPAAPPSSCGSALPVAQASTAAASLPQPEEPPAADPRAAELLHNVESLLAGCDSTALDVPQPDVPLPEHLELGRPVLAVPPWPAGNGAAAGSPLELGDGPAALGQGSSIAAFRPSGMAANGEGGAGAGRQPATPAEAAGGGSPADAVPWPAASALGSQWVPASLQDALQCLGLLAQQTADSGEGAGTSSSAAAGVPRWLRLHAVRVVVAGKRAAAAEELAPLLRRLRQVHAHLAFHQVGAWRVGAGVGRDRKRETHFFVQLLACLACPVLIRRHVCCAAADYILFALLCCRPTCNAVEARGAAPALRRRGPGSQAGPARSTASTELAEAAARGCTHGPR